jgi:hypothetical protein
MPRKTDVCINCGETREMAAHGLCYTCYRKDERADDRKFAGVDRHNPGIRREHKKLFRGFTSIMGGLSDLAVSSADVITIRGIIGPYLTAISKFLAPVPAQDEGDGEVNGEQQPETGSQFTRDRM